jgi:hypothetical protein
LTGAAIAYVAAAAALFAAYTIWLALLQFRQASLRPVGQVLPVRLALAAELKWVTVQSGTRPFPF